MSELAYQKKLLSDLKSQENALIDIDPARKLVRTLMQADEIRKQLDQVLIKMNELDTDRCRQEFAKEAKENIQRRQAGLQPKHIRGVYAIWP